MRSVLEPVIEVVMYVVAILAATIGFASLASTLIFLIPQEGKILERDFKAGIIHVRHVDAESARKLIDHKHVTLVSQYDHPDHPQDVFVFEVTK